MAPIAMVVGAVASVVGTVKSAKAQKKSLALQKQQQEVQTRRSRRQAIREMQIRRAASVSGAVGAGTFGGSGSMGGIGSLGSQLGESLGFSTQMSGLSEGINAAERSSITGQTIAGLGSTVFNMGQGAAQAGGFKPYFGIK